MRPSRPPSCSPKGRVPAFTPFLALARSQLVLPFLLSLECMKGRRPPFSRSPPPPSFIAESLGEGARDAPPPALTIVHEREETTPGFSPES